VSALNLNVWLYLLATFMTEG
jgi:hypothetical protein